MGPEAIIHLAAVASTREASRDPASAWVVNTVGTARLVEAAASLKESGTADPMVLVISTGEVYGVGSAAPRVETDPLLPHSPYAASKVGAEVAALEAWRRAGLRVVIARPFTHTGPGQATQYVIPGWAERLRAAKYPARPRSRRATLIRCAISSTCVTSWRRTACSSRAASRRGLQCVPR